MKKISLILIILCSILHAKSQSFTIHKQYNDYCSINKVTELKDSSIVMLVSNTDVDTVNMEYGSVKTYLYKIKNGFFVDSLLIRKDSISSFFPANQYLQHRGMFALRDTIYVLFEVTNKYTEDKNKAKQNDSVSKSFSLLRFDKNFNYIPRNTIDSNLSVMYAAMSITHDDSSLYIWAIDPFQNANILFTKANLGGEKVAQNTNKHYDFFNKIGFVNGKIAVTSYNYNMYYMYDPNTLTAIDSFCIQFNTAYDLIYPVGDFHAFHDSLFVAGGSKCNNYNCDDLDATFMIFNSKAAPVSYKSFGITGKNDGEQSRFTECLDFVTPSATYYVTSINSKYSIEDATDSVNLLLYYKWNLDVNPPQLVWSKQYGGDAEYRLANMIATQDGGLFMVVSRRDMPVGSRSPWDLLFIKTDANGNFTSVIENHQTISDLTIYPNPGNGIIRLSGSAFENNHRKTVRVFDMNGKMVFEQDGIALSDFNINLGNQPVGIYLVQLTDNRLVQSVKYQLIR